MLAVTENRTKRVGGWQGSCAVCVDLQAVGALEFFGELYRLGKGFGPFLRGFGQALEKGRVLFSAFRPLYRLYGSCMPSPRLLWVDTPLIPISTRARVKVQTFDLSWFL